MLQTYATQALIAEASAECTTIDYRQPGGTDTARGYREPTPGFSGMTKDLLYRVFRERGARNRGKVFEKFLVDRIQLSSTRFESFDALAEHNWPQDALYCVGSDQVWNLEANGDNRPYYLDFAPEQATKFSLASSIGMDSLPASEERHLVESLSTFSSISVRETGAVDYLASLGIKSACHVDPALALTGEQWSKVAGDAPSWPTPYVLVYQLNANPELEKAAAAIGKKLALPVVRMEYWQTFRGRGSAVVMRPSVERFLALIRDTSVLITDSFHGAALAMDLGTRMVSIRPPRDGGRLDSLLDQFDLRCMRAASAGEAVEVVKQHDHLPDRQAQLHIEQDKVRRYLSDVIHPGPGETIGYESSEEEAR
ncbi:MAG: polysaccharide pyruvyl transferase family protein [Acidipropionibacterium jensenii]|nr:polysaccharide pyruvyl transferase family protein [Acidipropionibacterium jensenii]